MATLPTPAKKADTPATSNGSRNRRPASRTPNSVRQLSQIGKSHYGDPRAFFTGRDIKYLNRAAGWVFYGEVNQIERLEENGEILVAMEDEKGNDTYLIVNSFVEPNGKTVEDVMDALNSGRVEGVYCVGATTVRIPDANGPDTFLNVGVVSDILLTDGHIRLKGASMAAQKDETAAMSDEEEEDIESALQG